MADVQDTLNTSKMSENKTREEPTEEEENLYNEEDMEEGMAEMRGDETRGRPEKRDREEYNDEFTTVSYKKKLKKEKIQVYISHKDKLPKQFALAKLLKEHKIEEISSIKYLTPYKIRIDFEREQPAENLLANHILLEKGWNIQKAMEVNSSYGVIRDVDLDLSDEEIFKSISCLESAALLSAIRLKRRDTNGAWVPSETVRLCFKGPRLPPYVFVAELRIKVIPFVFPVSQCSRCWKFGHTTKRCPTNKIICPKCGSNHVNCDTKKFRCVNCNGNHMALVKSCPEYIKEKEIREIMAEFNYIYSKARNIYILRTLKPLTNIHTNNNSRPIFTPEPAMERNPESNYIPTTCEAANSCHESSPILGYRNNKPIYANLLKKNSDMKETESYISYSNQTLNDRHKKKIYKINRNKYTSASRSSTDNEHSNSDSNEEPSRRTEPTKKTVSFKELLSRLKEIVFIRRDSTQKKIKNVIKCCLEWLILVVTDSITDWSALKSILQFVNG